MLDLATIRQQFPALTRTHQGKPIIFADGPAGSQVPRSVAEAVGGYLLTCNANTGGCFATSCESDELLQRAHRATADFLGTDDPECVVYGNNMTTLTFAFSRALAQTWQAGDEIVLSRCDHDANVTPWALAARDRGVTVRWIEVRPDDCTLDLESFQRVLSKKTRLVAVGVASNAVGTVHPVRTISRLAHDAGALVFADAVHYAPHLPIDVKELGVDVLTCSAYKFFGPHVGILWGRRELLESLQPYKVRPATNELPGRWMTGTQNHEGIVGVKAAVDYLAGFGAGHGLRERIVSAMNRIGEHERSLSARFLGRMQELPDYRIYGITSPERLQERVPTFGITHRRLSPIQLSQHPADRGIFTWAGNFYALPLTEALGLEPHGMLRLGFLHYNTLDEVDRVVAALADIG